MPDGALKGALLRTLAGSVCPICQGVKKPQTWGCKRCVEPYLWSPEHRALSERCAAHLEAAETFLAMVNARTQKPETD